MSQETYIPGKDASLEASIRTMHQKLKSLGFQVEERSWLNPVEGVWSVHVADRDCPLLFTNGKGGSRLAALASALGEFFERLATHYFWAPYYLGEELSAAPFVHYPEERWFPLHANGRWPKGLLTPELRRFYDPDGAIPVERMVEMNTGTAARGICALPYIRQRDKATVWFPVNIIENLYVSNGMAAGNSPEEARAQALSEIIERYVKFRIITEGLRLPEVPAAVIARYPRIEAGIRELHGAGFGILVRDASLGGHYPVINVTLLNPDDQGCFASFGAHPRFEVALERALTELLQGRALDALNGFPEPSFDQEEISHPANLEMHFVDSSGVVGWNFLADEADFPFADWNFSATVHEDCAWLVDRLHSDGRDVYIAEFAHLGVYACRIVVPGISEIYPIDDLEWNNNSVGNELRPLILALPDLDEEGCSQLAEALDELDEAQPIEELIGLAPDPDSPWKGLRVGELKTLLALALGDEEGAREGCQWIRHFGQLAAARARVYRCLEGLLNLGDSTGYDTGLAYLYGADTLSRARALLDGSDRFFGLTALGPTFDGSRLHQRLLAAFEKVRQPQVEALDSP